MIIKYEILPERMREPARLYIEKGIKPGGFLMVVFSNDLVSTFGRADELNRAALPAWCRFLFNEAPRDSWGSRDNVKEWIKGGGLQGRQA